PDDDAVRGGPRARLVRPRRRRAVLAHPLLVGRGLRGVRRLVLRQDEPRAPVLALARSRGDAVRRQAGAGAAERGRGLARGVLARARLLRLLGRRSEGARAGLLLVHGARAAGAARPALAARRCAL